MRPIIPPSAAKFPYDAAFLPLKAEHLTAAAALHYLSFNRPWSEAEMLELLRHGAEGWLLLSAQKKLLSFVMIRCAADEAEILTLATDGECRGKGLAYALLTQAIAELADSGITQFFLDVREDNASAIYLYEKLGFVHIATRKNYYRRKDGGTRHGLVYRLSQK